MKSIDLDQGLEKKLNDSLVLITEITTLKKRLIISKEKTQKYKKK